MAGALQHATAAFVAGLPAGGAGSSRLFAKSKEEIPVKTLPRNGRSIYRRSWNRRVETEIPAKTLYRPTAAATVSFETLVGLN